MVAKSFQRFVSTKNISDVLQCLVTLKALAVITCSHLQLSSYFFPYESRFRGGILLLGFLLFPTAQRKSQTSMKILIYGFNVCANAQGRISF